jgi:hypothetical protein
MSNIGFTVAAIKHDRSINESCGHTCEVRVLGSITFYSPVYWDVVDKNLLFWTEKCGFGSQNQ